MLLFCGKAPNKEKLEVKRRNECIVYLMVKKMEICLKA